MGLPRQNSSQPSKLLRLVNTLLLPLFKALPLTWLIYPRLLMLRLLTQLSLMPTLLAKFPSLLPLFSPEFNLLMLSNPLSLLPLSPLSPLLLTPMPTTMVPTVPTLPTPMLPMLVLMLVTPMLVPTDTPPMPSVDTPMPSPWQLPKPNKVKKSLKSLKKRKNIMPSTKNLLLANIDGLNHDDGNFVEVTKSHQPHLRCRNLMKKLLFLFQCSHYLPV